MMGWERGRLRRAGRGPDPAPGSRPPDPYNHLTLNPALCPYLRGRLEPAELADTDRPLGRGHGAVCRVPGPAAEPADRGRRDPDGAGAAEPLRTAGSGAGGRGAGGDHRPRDQALPPAAMARPAAPARARRAGARCRGAGARATAGRGWSHARFEAERTRIEQQLRRRAAARGARRAPRRCSSAPGRRVRAAYPGADYDLAMACFLLARVLKTAGGAEPALPLLDEAQAGLRGHRAGRAGPRRRSGWRPSASPNGATVCATWAGSTSRRRPMRRASRRDEQRGDERDVAVGKGQPRHGPTATSAATRRHWPPMREARERFARLGEPGSVAVVWHQTGMAYQESGNPEAAEDAYRESLAIKVRLGDTAGQASTLNQLGNLYDDCPEPPRGGGGLLPAGGGPLCRRSAIWRRRARQEQSRRHPAPAAASRRGAPGGPAGDRVQGASSATPPSPGRPGPSSPTSRPTPANPGAAAAARTQALAAYLAYRRDGGENHDRSGRLALAVTEPLSAGDPAAAQSLLRQVAADPEPARTGCAPSSPRSRPSPPAAATPPSPTPRTWTTPCPPRSCS